VKNVVKLQNYFYPWDLAQAIEDFVDNHNHDRYHESLNNLSPANVYFGRVGEVKNRREMFKELTFQMKGVQNFRKGCVQSTKERSIS
jgi:hypothetical protein